MRFSALSAVALLCGGMLSSVAYADNCDRARNTYDDIYCKNKVFASADAELNRNYKALRAQLNSRQQAILKRAQLNWINQRDRQCVVDEQGVDVDCRLEMTQSRNHWLQERLRECRTIGCKTSALSCD